MAAMSRLHWTYRVVTECEDGPPVLETVRFPSPAWWAVAALALIGRSS